MKAALVLFVLATAANATPVGVKAIDWAAVQTVVDEVFVTVDTTLNNIIAEAKKGDAVIGQEVEDYLNSKIPEALAILDEVNEEIKNQTLTVEKAEKYFERLETLLMEAMSELEPLINQLPQENGDKIRAEFRAAYANVEALAEEIYALLAQ